MKWCKTWLQSDLLLLRDIYNSLFIYFKTSFWGDCCYRQLHLFETAYFRSEMIHKPSSWEAFCHLAAESSLLCLALTHSQEAAVIVITANYCTVNMQRRYWDFVGRSEVEKASGAAVLRDRGPGKNNTLCHSKTGRFSISDLSFNRKVFLLTCQVIAHRIQSQKRAL